MNMQVLVSARTELMFLLVAGMVLCLRFRMRIMLITHRYLVVAVLTQSQGLSFLYHPESEEAKGAQEAGRGHSQDS